MPGCIRHPATLIVPFGQPIAFFLNLLVTNITHAPCGGLCSGLHFGGDPRPDCSWRRLLLKPAENRPLPDRDPGRRLFCPRAVIKGLHGGVTGKEGPMEWVPGNCNSENWAIDPRR